jgi:hypothetical protein
MAFLKIRTMYVIGNANGKQYLGSYPLASTATN